MALNRDDKAYLEKLEKAVDLYDELIESNFKKRFEDLIVEVDVTNHKLDKILTHLGVDLDMGSHDAVGNKLNFNERLQKLEKFIHLISRVTNDMNLDNINFDVKLFVTDKVDSPEFLEWTQKGKIRTKIEDKKLKINNKLEVGSVNLGVEIAVPENWDVTDLKIFLSEQLTPMFITQQPLMALRDFQVTET
jgi:hypothetical protein